VTEIDLHITEQYMSATFNSCRQVSVPSTGQLALDLMCGSWGSSKCSPTRWYTFMGDASGNPFVPFQINYRAHNSTLPIDNDLTPLDPKVVPCSESIDGIKPACSCVDCAASCPKPPTPEPEPRPFIIWDLDGYAVVMFFIFLVGSAMFVMGTGCCSNSASGESN
jgi:Niemann-Pick C1 protein